MKVYIQKGTDNECPNPNMFLALDGFRQMGWEICPFYRGRDISDNEPENVVVGGISQMKEVFLNLGIPEPPTLSYPEELHPFLGRRIWYSTLHTVSRDPACRNVFVKPAHHLKTFTGLVIREDRDLIGCYDPLNDLEVLCSEPVRFLSEWRCFVRYGRILDVRGYKGNWRLHFDYRVLESALAAYTSAPAGYVMDFGLTDTGETLLVEVNDGYSVGAYGLFSLDYAKLLSARWAQLTGSKDYCDF